MGRESIIMNKWDILDSEYIYQNESFGSIRRDKCLLPNGIIIDNYYSYELPNWVNAIVITKNKEIVLVKQYRHGIKDFILEVPAGTLKKDEDPDACIIREVIEETGFSSEHNPLILGEYYTNPALFNNKIKTYLIMEAEKIYSQNLDDTEELSVHLCSIEEVDKYILDGTISHQFTVFAYLLAKQHISNLLRIEE